MTKVEKKRIKEYLQSAEENIIVDAWNDWMESYNNERCIYLNDEDFFNTYYSNDVMQAIRATHYGNYQYLDDYICFNNRGNLDTFNYLSDENSPYNEDELCDYIYNNQDREGFKQIIINTKVYTR